MDLQEIIVKADRETSEDVSREEEEWTERHEELLKTLRQKCLASAGQHKAASDFSVRLYHGCMLPSLTLPLIAAYLDAYTESPLWVAASLILTGTGLNAVSAFLNFGKLSAQYEQFAGRYADLDEQISLTLARHKRAREPCDVAMTKFIHTHGLLNASAPRL